MFLVQPTLSYVPESCHATRTKIGLQCLLLISSRTSSLASFKASLFVVLLAVSVAAVFEITSQRHRGFLTARTLCNLVAHTKCLCATMFPVCAIALACPETSKRITMNPRVSAPRPVPKFAVRFCNMAAVDSLPQYTQHHPMPSSKVSGAYINGQTGTLYRCAGTFPKAACRCRV